MFMSEPRRVLLSLAVYVFTHGPWSWLYKYYPKPENQTRPKKTKLKSDQNLQKL